MSPREKELRKKMRIAYRGMMAIKPYISADAENGNIKGNPQLKRAYHKFYDGLEALEAALEKDKS